MVNFCWPKPWTIYPSSSVIGSWKKHKNIVEPNPVELLRRELAQTPLGDMAESLALLKQNQQQQQQQQQQPQQQQQQQTPDHMNPLSLMQAISSAQRNQGSSQPQTSREMTLPAGLVAALVARNKLAEIRGVIRSRASTKKSSILCLIQEILLLFCRHCYE